MASALAVGCARSVAIRWWRVPDDDPDLYVSLAPSVEPGDWLLLWRLTPPSYGDLVLCPDPAQRDEIVVGRIAAKAGDELLVRADGQLEVNGRRMRGERACERPLVVTEQPRTGEPVELRCDIEVLGGVHHRRGRAASGTKSGQPFRTRVARDHFFLVSDNRKHPFDSRDYGSVPHESCSETVFFRLIGGEGYFDAQSRFNLIR